MGLLSSFHTHQVIIGNLRIPLLFQFTQNPNKFTFRLEKQYNQTQTVGGYVYEMWGKKPTILDGEVTIKKDNSAYRLLGLNDKSVNFELGDYTMSSELLTLQTLFNIDQRKLAKSGMADTLSKVATTALGVTTALANPVAGVTAVFSALKSGSGSLTRSTYSSPEQTTTAGYMNTMTDTIIYYKGCIYTGFFTSMSFDEDGMTPFANKVRFKFLVTGTTYDWIDTMLVNTASGRGISSVLGAASSIATLSALISQTFKNASSLIKF